MKAFVTGGTGFIGGRLVRRLRERGDQVHALVRSDEGAAKVQMLGAEAVWGDVSDRESLQAEPVREAMQGSDVVFHLAAWYKVGSKDASQAEKINVEGTRNVLELAHELGVPKIVYTSTVAIYGDTHGKLVTEEDVARPGPFLTEYDRTKWRAHYEVALPLIEKGAPVVIVMPGVAYGPGDPSLMGEFMRRFYLGHFPIFPAPNLTVTWAHVDDIVEGHILAADKGRIGESYFLAGPAVRLGDMSQVWAALLRRPGPLWHIPPGLAKMFAPVVEFAAPAIDLPEIFSPDAFAIIDATYIASSEKARTELGWQVRPLREGMEEAFNWMSETYGKGREALAPAKQAAGLALGAAAGVLIFWLGSRRRK